MAIYYRYSCGCEDDHSPDDEEKYVNEPCYRCRKRQEEIEEQERRDQVRINKQTLEPGWE